MAEFQSRWNAEKKSGNAARDATDSTDSFAISPKLSVLSVASGCAIPEKNLADQLPVTHPSVLSADEAEAVGFNPLMTWVRVACAPIQVEPAIPPADCDRTLPAGCCHRDLCSVLGICPHAVARCGATTEKE